MTRSSRPPCRNPRQPLTTRRAVVSVLAMMFLVLFGSLGLAMTISSKGNLRTASTQLHVYKALGAAETGLAVAKARLQEAAGRFIVDRGTMDGTYAAKLWSGTLSGGDGQKTVLAPPSGFGEQSLPAGIAQAVVNVHAADSNTVTVSGLASSPVVSSAPAGTDTSVYAASNWVVTAPVAIEGAAASGSLNAAFQITYAPLANGTDIRIIATGFSSLGTSGSGFSFRSHAAAADRSLTRTISQDFRIVKRPRHAVLSPSRVLIGKNVQVTGDLATRYDETTFENGEPSRVKSDFYGLNATLDDILDALYVGVVASDIDGDNRLRTAHAGEAAGLPTAATNPSLFADGAAPFADATRDGYVDDFDLFLNFYGADDGTGRKRVDLSGVAVPDTDLMYLVDSAVPDRNRNSVFGYTDANTNGRWEETEVLLDDDDVVLGYLDGIIDYKDQYAKVRGSLSFKVTSAQWLADQGSYKNFINGPISAKAGQAPVSFGVADSALPTIDASTFANPQATLSAKATGGFNAQVGTQIGWSSTDLANYPSANNQPGQPQYWRASLDNAVVKAATGQDLWEKMPFNSPAFTDYYIRPRYVNMTFTNATIPKGNNGLFVNCKFIGVTLVDCETGNTNSNWNLYGRLKWDIAQAKPVPYTDPLDKSDFLRYTSGIVTDGPANYADFPDPPVIAGQIRTGAARDTKLYSNNLRFHNCEFVGSIVAPTPSTFTHVRNKVQFTGSTRFRTMMTDSNEATAANFSSSDVAELKKSAMILPNYSVDIGTFNSPTDSYTGSNPPTPQSVQLTGTVIAGVLDARGNTTIDGSLMLTFDPTPGVGPLEYFGQSVGNPALFNTSLGYFGDEDGDGESLDPETLPLEGGIKIVGWDSDGDGLADLPHTPRPDAGQIASGAITAVPFYGYGRVVLNWNPNLPMPDGIMLPVQAVALAGTYREGQR
ncbi:MAG: hypothetical protein ACKVS8_02920 [Phycisphaerales bacterium]